MAGYDAPREDPLTFFRTEVPPADLARARLQWEAQAAADAQAKQTLIALAALLLLVVLLAALLKRRQIARAADTALVAGLASSVRAARKVRSKRDSLKARVMAKADDPPSS